MITSSDELRAALQRGEAVALQGAFEGDGFRLALTATGETVRRTALAACLSAGDAVVVSLDLAGEPLQYAAPPYTQTSGS